MIYKRPSQVCKGNKANCPQLEGANTFPFKFYRNPPVFPIPVTGLQFLRLQYSARNRKSISILNLRPLGTGRQIKGARSVSVLHFCCLPHTPHINKLRSTRHLLGQKIRLSPPSPNQDHIAQIFFKAEE